MIRRMTRWGVVFYSVLSAAILGACGGDQHAQPTTTPPPVADQVRQALTDALQKPAFADPLHPNSTRLPYLAVHRCTGPQLGRAGTYRCTTTPRGAHGVRTVQINVQPNGAWSTQPLPVKATLGGHRTSASTGIFGTGLRFPG